MKTIAMTSLYHPKRWAGALGVLALFIVGGCNDPQTTADSSAAQTHAKSSDLVTSTPQPSQADIKADPFYASAYIDIDEWREEPVLHRYVHGGFTDTTARFSFYFPPADLYEGRFFQHITPVPDSENLAVNQPPGAGNKIGFSIASGGYFVETNGGGKFDLSKLNRADPTLSAYRANAAAARYSRVVAQAIYGGDRPFGYAYGGSGGGYRTIGAAENTQGVWDGFVPYVIGSTMAIPNSFTARLQALRVLRDKFPAIVDAVDAGGSGDPFATLNQLEREALNEVTAMGFPLPGWFAYKTMGLHGFAALYGGIVAADPSYFEDFWTKPGYLGYDDPERYREDRLQFTAPVAELITAADAARAGLNIDASSERERGEVDTAFQIPEGAEGERIVGFRLKQQPPPVYFMGGDLILNSGEQQGKRVPLARIIGDVVIFGFADPSVINDVKPGDSVTVDNSNFLAIETYHRHQVPGPDYTVWDEWRKEDGTPKYPQRPRLIGPGFVQATSGSLQTGKFSGKMIVVSSLWDQEAYPWQADWYRQRVEAHLGDETDNHFRLWYSDHAVHGDTINKSKAGNTFVVSYIGMLHQALRDVARWAEEGVPPAPNTQYHIERGQLTLPNTAEARAGINPVVTLTTEAGDKRIEIKVGDEVVLQGSISAPPGTGLVTGADWHWGKEGDEFTADPGVPKGQQLVTVTARHSYNTPGTYFVALRGSVERTGDSAPYAQLYNLDRVRVIVQE